MSHASSSARNTAYYLHIENLPEKYTWQNLKDLIRNCAWHGVWAEKAVYPNGVASGTGFARVKKEKEAQNLYNYLTKNKIEGRYLIVHLWDVSSSPPELKASNNPERRADRLILRLTYAHEWQPISPPGVPPMSPATQAYQMAPQLPYTVSPVPLPTASSTAALSQSMQGLQVQQANWTYPPQTQYAHPSLPPAQHMSYPASNQVYTSSRVPINIAEGYATTESRGIFVSGLDFNATRADIERHFGRAGEINSVKLMKGANKSSKGCATIRYASAQEAQRAIEKFNGKEWMKRKLTVRIDRDNTVVDPPRAGPASQPTNRNGTPIIVNGSQIYPDSSN